MRLAILLCLLLGAPLSAQVSLTLQARQAIEAGDLDSAQRLFRQVLQNEPENGEAHYYLAQISARRGDDRATVEHFLAALERIPDQEVVWREYGAWLLSQQYFGEAGRVFEHLTTQYPARREYWTQRGWAVYGEGDPEAAIEFYQKALEMVGAGPREHYLMGVAQRSLGRTREARRYFESGLAADPADPEISYQMADLLLQQGEPEPSLAFWAKLPPQDPRRLYGEAVAKARLGMLVEARDALTSLVEADPNHTRAHYQLALLYRRLGDETKSASLFDRFRELEARDRENRKTRGKKEIVRRNDG